MSVFSEVLAKTGLPEAALTPIEAKLQEAFDLIVENNKRVAQVNAAKAQDPNNVDYLDSLWRTHAVDDPKIAAIEPRYQALTEELEKLLVQLREESKKHIPEQLSEEKTKEVRVLVNQSAPAIEKAKEAAETMVSVVEAVLAAKGEAIDGGILSMLPPIESLKNKRGRAAATADGIAKYMTRASEILVNGKSTNRIVNGESAGKFNYAAEDLSATFNAEKFPENRVTPDTLEEAYYKSLGIQFRLKSANLPEEHAFTFEKTVKVQNKNDDGTTDLPQKVQVIVKRASKAKTETDEKVEEPKNETAEPAKAKASEAKTQPAKSVEAKK